MPGPDIFLSYNREDQAVARRFAEGFEAAGLSVWWDVTLRSGDAYDAVTEEALKTARAVVVLWSERSVVSRWVRAEATLAGRNRTLVPARIEPCELPIMFELTQTADLAHWQGEAGDAAWQAFLGDVRRMVGQESSAREEKVEALPVLSESGVPIVAVLPFSCRGADEALEFLCEDLTEDVTREMGRATYYEVIAAGTMAGLRGKQVDYRKLGLDLGPRFLVEGKLQRGGDTVRLTIQLIDPAASKMVWSQRYARDSEDIEAAPESLVQAVTSDLGENIVRHEVNRAITKSGPLSGWEHLMRAVAFNSRMGSDSLRRSIEETGMAVAAAPDLGLAHAMLAQNLALLIVDRGEEPGDAEMREIRAHVTRALQLDGDNPGVISSLAPAYQALGDTESCLRLAKRAIELQPNSATFHAVLGIGYLILGHIGDAIATFERQERIATHDLTRYVSFVHLGICHVLEGRLAEAEHAIARSLALHPDYHNALKWKAIVAALRGDEAAALAAIGRLRQSEPCMTIDQHTRQIGVVYAALGDRVAEPVATLRRLWAATGGDG